MFAILISIGLFRTVCMFSTKVTFVFHELYQSVPSGYTPKDALRLKAECIASWASVFQTASFAIFCHSRRGILPSRVVKIVVSDQSQAVDVRSLNQRDLGRHRAQWCLALC